MAKVDREFSELLYLTIEKIVTLYSSSDVANNTTEMNKLVNTVTLLEDLLIHYSDPSVPEKKYAPKITGDKLTDTHYRIRDLIKIAKAVSLSPPKRFTGDARKFKRPIPDKNL